VFFAGVCVGTVLTRFSPSTVNVSFDGSFFQVFLVLAAICCLAVVFILIVTTAIANGTSPARTESGGAAFACFLVLAVMYGLSSCEGPKGREGRETSELLAQSTVYEKAGDVEAAIVYLERAIAIDKNQNGESTDLGKVLVAKMEKLLNQRSNNALTGD
jgi:hypothetical protein